jgi:hypothetical protein
MGDDPVRTERRRLVLAAALHAHHLATLLPALRSAGVEPILLKGLAAARHYPSPEARPCLGDIDLLVPEARMQRAAGALAAQGFCLHHDRAVHGRPPVIVATRDAVTIDLQSSLWPLPEAEARAALRHPETAVINGQPVGMLPPTTEVRFLAVHAAKHAFARPIWLCDLVAAVESARLIDWDAILCGPRLTRSWIAAAFDLAGGLLGLGLPTAVAGRIAGRGIWLAEDVLAAWGRTSPTAGVARPQALMQALWDIDPAGAVRVVRHVWPDPGESLATLGWPLDAPLAPAAVAAVVVRRSWQCARRWQVYRAAAAPVARGLVPEAA